jgi:gliding motility-associated-like protein
MSNVVLIEVIEPLEAGENQDLGCIILEDVQVTLAASGTGVWSQSTSNPGQVIFSDENDANAEVSGFALAGTYTFTWSNGICSDEITVTLEEKKEAGEDQIIDCFVDGSTTLDAEGLGTWTMGVNNPGTVQISSFTDPKAVLTNFEIDGVYEFIWTSNGCEDRVVVEVNDACPCVVESNEIIDNVSDVFCKTTGELMIIGEEALPAGGTYLWQISIKGSGFSDAPGVNNLKDYDASNMGEGTYILRRLYTLNIDGQECSDLSEEIEFFVFDIKQDPGEIFYTPNPVCLGDSLLLEVDYNPNLTYEWQIMSGNGRVLYALDSMSMILVESPGIITVSVTQFLEGCDKNLVSQASEIMITVLDNPKPDLGRDTTYCELKESFTLYPGDFEEYEWQDGSNESEFLVEHEGIYSVSVIDSMGCIGTDMVNIKSFCCEFAYPNIFKADSRGGNSEFIVTDIYDCVIKAEVFIYDRWGNLVYIGDGLESWDGTFNGKFVEQGVYVFIYKYTAMDADRQEFEDEIHGDITVLR